MEASTIYLALLFFAVSIVSMHVGKMSERDNWNKLIERGSLPKPGQRWRLD